MRQVSQYENSLEFEESSRMPNPAGKVFVHDKSAHWWPVRSEQDVWTTRMNTLARNLRIDIEKKICRR
jgi:hypothetical protein